ncbi:MAG: hypothetical protein H7831_18245, partial [Magnetococcus sp. WYHC-3]
MGILYKSLTLLALAGVLSACGAGDVGGGAASGAAATPGGTALDGPLMNATVTARSANGTVCVTTTTGNNGRFTLPSVSGCTYPLLVEVTGGQDMTSGGSNTVTWRSVLVDAQTPVVNAGPLTTLIYEAARTRAGAAANITQTDLDVARAAVMRQFGFGADSQNSDVNPLTTDLNSTTAAARIRADEAVAEMARRVAGAGNGTRLEAYFSALGEDISDGSLDGSRAGSTLSTNNTASLGLSGPQMATLSQVATSTLVGELLSNNLTITLSDGTRANASDVQANLAAGIAAVVSGAGEAMSESQANATLAQLPVSKALLQQAKSAIKSVLDVAGNAEISTSNLTAFQSAVDSMLTAVGNATTLSRSAAAAPLANITNVTLGVANETGRLDNTSELTSVQSNATQLQTSLRQGTANAFSQNTLSDIDPLTVFLDALLSMNIGNTLPAISTPSAVNVLSGHSSSSVSFTVGDTETPVANLTVTATADNTTLLPASAIVLGGSGASRTVTVTPPAGVGNGTTTVTLTVNDGFGSSAAHFPVYVSAPVVEEPHYPSNNTTSNVTLLNGNYGVMKLGSTSASPTARVFDLATLGINGTSYACEETFSTASPLETCNAQILPDTQGQFQLTSGNRTWSTGAYSPDGQMLFWVDPGQQRVGINMMLERGSGLSNATLSGGYHTVQGNVYGYNNETGFSVWSSNMTFDGEGRFCDYGGMTCSDSNQTFSYAVSGDGLMNMAWDYHYAAQNYTTVYNKQGVVAPDGDMFAVMQTGYSSTYVYEGGDHHGLFNSTTQSGSLALVLGVKQSTNATNAVLEGTYALGWMDLGGMISGFDRIGFNGEGNGTLTTQVSSQGNSSADIPVTYSVSSNGAVSLNISGNSYLGAVSPDGEKLVLGYNNYNSTARAVIVGTRRTPSVANMTATAKTLLTGADNFPDVRRD